MRPISGWVGWAFLLLTGATVSLEGPVAAQEATGAAKQFGALKTKLPTAIDVDHAGVQHEYKAITGKLEVARMVSPGRAKVFVTLQAEPFSGRKTTHRVIIYLRHYRGEWKTQADYHCTWSKTGKRASVSLNLVAHSIAAKIEELCK